MVITQTMKGGWSPGDEILRNENRASNNRSLLVECGGMSIDDSFMDGFDQLGYPCSFEVRR